MVPIDNFISTFSETFGDLAGLHPWFITKSMPEIILALIPQLDDEYIINEGIAIHQSATIETGAVIKGPIIICAGCFIGANAYLRGGVYLAESVSIGPGCEVKSSMVFENSTVAHFNFIGDCLIGSNVNFEAGAHTANHYNERANKNIFSLYLSKTINTEVEKFGALVGDNSKIGANAVLSPGTILLPNSIIKRLELVEQII